MNSNKTDNRLAVPSDDEMYTAVSRRDADYDGVFFYGVITTGVFCKPSCGARLARRENVSFYHDAESAQQAGFRPCKRCRPDNLRRDVEKMIGIARFIEAHGDEKLTLAALSRQANLSTSRLQKAFKAVFGVSPKEFQDSVRFASFKDALRSGDDVTGAIFSAGFGSTSRVYGEAARNMGMTPARYRAGGADESIYYAYRDSSLGPLMLAATERGVCFAQFGDGQAELQAQLAAEFPQARLFESSNSAAPDLDHWIDALDAHLNQHAPRPDLPMDLRGTSFQLQVWRFLLSVKEGDVVSYGELARGIGKPQAVRAVASACGANRVGVLVPCHRVLRGNGDLGGYRWGTERKRTLLAIEKQNRVASS